MRRSLGADNGIRRGSGEWVGGWRLPLASRDTILMIQHGMVYRLTTEEVEIPL